MCLLVCQEDGGGLRNSHSSVCVRMFNFPPVCIGEFSMCRVNNGGCQDLCLLTSEGRVNCSCRGDRKLLEDNTCIGNTCKAFIKTTLWLAIAPYKDIKSHRSYAFL